MTNEALQQAACFVLAVTVSTVLALAQPAPQGAASRAEGALPTGPLSLPECIRIALEHNPDVAGAVASVQAANAHLGEVRSADFPALDLTAGAERGRALSTGEIGGAPTQTSADGTISLQYLLFDGGERAARIAAAADAQRATALQRDSIVEALALRVTERYYGLLAAQWAREVAEVTRRSAEYHVDLARARHAAGLVPRSDVLRAETELADAALGVVQARSASRITEGELATAMGVPVTTVVRVESGPETALAQRREGVEAMLALAERARPELQASRALEEAARAAVREAKAQWWPRVSSGADYAWRDDSLLEARDSWSLGVRLTLPLFTGFERGARLERTTAERRQAEAAYQVLLRDVELEVWSSYAQLDEAEEAIQATTALVASAEESARLAEGEYKSGTGSIIGLIDAQTALSSARLRQVAARLALHTAMARLDRAVGRSLIASAASAGEKLGGTR